MALQISPPSEAGGKIGRPRLGLGLTATLMLFYFGFVGLGAFAPSVLARPLVDGGTVTVAFAYGLFVIALGVALTGIYVLIANRESIR
ncbi:DUF485 domain-containing protein [Methylobacterium sp. NEAU K]|uniref:DUF485 domain-containing protein n=1 Tax=Methylobacterium sp. NEAU K TaxID=3064946 RepID=UPI00273332EC|nr:DUF485 domain-containing protein [Methylobacterium sp. NEAU K]MDP4006066.1 DUF485 domain-containing protein [Methylobacterium sp. NEAU K]